MLFYVYLFILFFFSPPAWSVISTLMTKTQQDQHPSSLRARPSAGHTSPCQIDAHGKCPIRRRLSRAPSNQRGASGGVGGRRAAPERDIEIVEARRLVGHECHSLRVLIIWRGVCSARPRSPFQVEKSRRSWDRNLNWDDWWTRFTTGEIPSGLPARPRDRSRCRKNTVYLSAGRNAANVSVLASLSGMR